MTLKARMKLTRSRHSKKQGWAILLRSIRSSCLSSISTSSCINNISSSISSRDIVVILAVVVIVVFLVVVLVLVVVVVVVVVAVALAMSETHQVQT